MTAAAGPVDTAELRDTPAYATLHLKERLGPPERAACALLVALNPGKPTRLAPEPS